MPLYPSWVSQNWEKHIDWWTFGFFLPLDVGRKESSTL
jgi:hypothetical protein